MSPEQHNHDNEERSGWFGHEKDHDREHQVAKDTAERLEREVEETARRIDKGVETALQAVAETANVHARAHDKEHQAHERIHQVEKLQVDKAEASMNERLERMNEFRGALQDASSRMVTRDVFEAYTKERELRLQAALDRIVALEAEQAKRGELIGQFRSSQSDVKALDRRIAAVEAGSASGEAVDNVRNEARRQRNGFLVAAALLGLGVIVNLLVNLLQQAPT